MRLDRLPGWVVDEETSIRDEVADYVGQTPERLWQLTRMCARSAAWALGFHEDRRAVLEHRDPVPESTRAALERLRARTDDGRH